MGLFDRVFRGSDEMYFKAEAELNAAIAELGEDAAMTMPDTAYFLACIYAYLGKKVTKLSELKDCEAHASFLMGQSDEGILRKLGIRLTCEPVFPTKDLFYL